MCSNRRHFALRFASVFNSHPNFPLFFSNLSTGILKDNMGSNDHDSWDDFEWDAVSEAQVQAIEASYSSLSSSASALKRISTVSDSDSFNPKLKCRRLPNWSLQSSSHFSSSSSATSYLTSVRNPAIAPCRRVNYKYQAMRFSGKIIYCRTHQEAEKASKELSDKINAKKGIDPVALGFDIEWKPTFKRGETTRKAALMQICMDNSCCYVIHIIHSGIPSLLKSLLEDDSSIKVGVSIANDAGKMANDYGVKVQPVLDLSSLANIKRLGPPKQWSLSSLTETITSKELAKPGKIRLGNWEAGSLSSAQLNYAATDAFVSWFLYEVLNGMPDPVIEKDNMEKNENIS